MDTLMDTLMASALQQDSISDKTIPETHPTDIHQFPRNGWRAEDIKKCLGYTDDEYNQLYTKVEEAMRHAELLEASLTGQRKTKLFAVLEGILPHNDAPNIPDFLRIKALHQLAIRINHNVKTRSGHAHHRKRPTKPRRVLHPEMRRPRLPPAPVAKPLNTPSFHAPQPEHQVMNVGHYCGLGSMLLFGHRDDNTQSTCSLKHIARNVRPGAPITVDHVSFDAWKSLLEKDGVLHGPADDVSIMWKWGERSVKVPNDRVLRTVVEFMSTHGGFIEFNIKPAQSGEEHLTLKEAQELIQGPGNP
ncbi:MAG: hypothetical protein Q9166_005669 [cf. Caloplaca sp. 2 TL-2023]